MSTGGAETPGGAPPAGEAGGQRTKKALWSACGYGDLDIVRQYMAGEQLMEGGSGSRTLVGWGDPGRGTRWRSTKPEECGWGTRNVRKTS